MSCSGNKIHSKNTYYNLNHTKFVEQDWDNHAASSNEIVPVAESITIPQYRCDTPCWIVNKKTKVRQYDTEDVGLFRILHNNCITNGIRDALGYKRGVRVTFNDVHMDIMERSSTNNMFSYDDGFMNLITGKPYVLDDKLSDALDYEDYVDCVVEGNLFINNIKLRDYRLFHNSLACLISDKCKTVDEVFDMLVQAKIALYYFLNGKIKNIYLIMEILDRHSYSKNFTEYQLFTISKL